MEKRYSSWQWLLIAIVWFIVGWYQCRGINSQKEYNEATQHR
jgi:hypothetical protein